MRVERQRERERRAAARSRGNFDASAHERDEPAHDRQAEPHAAVVARARIVRLHEGLEELRDSFWRHADAGVAHFEAQQRAPVLEREREALLPRLRPSA